MTFIENVLNLFFNDVRDSDTNTTDSQNTTSKTDPKQELNKDLIIIGSIVGFFLLTCLCVALGGACKQNDGGGGNQGLPYYPPDNT